jgi:hypothetical protein
MPSFNCKLNVLMQRKLQEPIVSCALGKLYNKDSILEYLLDKSAYGDGEEICGHIRSLKVHLHYSILVLSLTLIALGRENTKTYTKPCPILGLCRR